MRVDVTDALAPTPVLKPAADPDLEIADPRFRALLPEARWASLPLAIRRRFSKRLANGESAVYAGEVLETIMSRAGWCLARLLIESDEPSIRLASQLYLEKGEALAF